MKLEFQNEIQQLACDRQTKVDFQFDFGTQITSLMSDERFRHEVNLPSGGVRVIFTCVLISEHFWYRKYTGHEFSGSSLAFNIIPLKTIPCHIKPTE